jgi:hypothetical protein
MNLKLLLIFLYCLIMTTLAFAQGENITSWQLNTTGQKAQYYNSSYTVIQLTDSSDVQEVCYNTDTIYVRASGLASFIMGPWPGDPFIAAGQDASYIFPRNPTYPTTNHSTVQVGVCGLWINGITIYTAGDGKSYKSSTNTNGSNGDGNWNTIAWVAHGGEMDQGGGHPDPHNVYHNHSNPYQLYDSTDKTNHSPLIGWAFDGFPIYGPYGYATATDATSGIKRMTVSYQLRNITDRSSTSPAGPAINSTFPLGTYIEDYEYVSNSGDLDEYNGRYCVTPEYPSGTYAYFLGTNADGTPTYPNILVTKYYGKTLPANFGPTGGSASKPSTGVSCVSTTSSSTPTVALSTAASTISENSGSTTVTATLSASTTSDVTINLSLSGTATVSADYTLATSIIITAGNTTGSITLTSVSDTKDENDETVIIDISSVTNGSESGTQQKTVTITDDDAAPAVTLSSSGSSIAENAGTSTVTATLSAASGLSVTVNLGFTGTASGSGVDYTASGSSITIAAGSTTGSVTLTSVNDTKDENDETVIIDISSVTNGSESGTQQKTVTITDDDAAPAVTLSSSGSSIAENGGSVILTATLSAASGLSVTVNLGFAGTATSAIDYTASGTSITIAAGSTTGTVTVTSVDDAIVDASETILASIATVTNGTESGTQQATITITDDDAVSGTSNSIVMQAALYPNPANGIFHLDLMEQVNEIIIMNDKGMVVKSIKEPLLENTIDLSGLNEGVYVIQVISEKGFTTRKITIQN